MMPDVDSGKESNWTHSRRWAVGGGRCVQLKLPFPCLF